MNETSLGYPMLDTSTGFLIPFSPGTAASKQQQPLALPALVNNFLVNLPPSPPLTSYTFFNSVPPASLPIPLPSATSTNAANVIVASPPSYSDSGASSDSGSDSSPSPSSILSVPEPSAKLMTPQWKPAVEGPRIAKRPPPKRRRRRGVDVPDEPSGVMKLVRGKVYYCPNCSTNVSSEWRNIKNPETGETILLCNACALQLRMQRMKEAVSRRRIAISSLVCQTPTASSRSSRIDIVSPNIDGPILGQ